MIIKRTTKFRLHAAASLLALVLGWLAVPLKLATWEPDVCEMECCVAAGHCCCATRHAYVAGHLPEPDEVTLNTPTELSAPCPATCAGAATSAKTQTIRVQHARLLFVALVPDTLAFYWKPFRLAYPFAAQPSAPRAPPFSNRLSA